MAHSPGYHLVVDFDNAVGVAGARPGEGNQTSRQISIKQGIGIGVSEHLPQASAALQGHQGERCLQLGTVGGSGWRLVRRYNRAWHRQPDALPW